MKKTKKLVITALSLSLTLSPVSVLAQTKKEAVYINLEKNGKPANIVVTNHLYYNGEKTLKDETELKEILNIHGEEKYKKEKNYLYWETNKSDIFYQGKTDKKLPITTNIKYYLNGKQVNPNDIVGKKGNIKITIDYQNNLKNEVVVNNQNQTLYTPFVVTLGTTLDSKNNKNIKITNGKVVETGTRSMLVSLASPGLYQSMNIKEFKNLDNITITYKTQSFALKDIYMVITPKLLDRQDFTVFDKMDDLYNNTKQLQKSMNELEKGANKLNKGAKNLSSGTEEISNNIKNVVNAVEKLSNGSEEINSGLKKVLSALNQAKKSLNNSNSSQNIKTLEYLKLQNTNTINSLISKTGLTYEELESYYISNDLANYTGEDEMLNQIKSAYELVYLLNGNNSAIESTIKSLTQMAGQVNDMITNLETNISKIHTGTSHLNSGIKQLETGVNKLYNGSISLTNGAKELSTGTNDLTKGITQFNSKGITELTNYSKTLKAKKDKTKQLINLANNYKGYASKNSKESTFIYKVNAIK